MRDERDLMIAKQAERISKLQEDYRRLQQTLSEQSAMHQREMDRWKAEHRRDLAAAQFWYGLDEQIRNTPTLQCEWDRFLMFLKLGAEDKYLMSLSGHKFENDDGKSSGGAAYA